METKVMLRIVICYMKSDQRCCILLRMAALSVNDLFIVIKVDLIN